MNGLSESTTNTPRSGPIPFSVLDLAPIVQGSNAREALKNTLDLAQHAEAWGFKRFWLAEHHSMLGIASAATSVVIGYVAAGTSSIRVGSGGVMLPNHSPLVIAEQFGTLESLYPGRIDLGLGRAPGSDPKTARALRRVSGGTGDTFPQDLLELWSYFRGGDADRGGVRAVPGEGLHVPLWLLGSSDFSARLAAELGLPFAFASHFAPDYLHVAMELYRDNFKPSEQCPEPYAMIAVNVFAADSDAEGRRLATSMQQQFLSLIRGRPGQMPPPVDDMNAYWSDPERDHVERMLRCSVTGTQDTIRGELEFLIAETGADEVMATVPIYDFAARLRSLEILAGLRDRGGGV